ncbi:MAG: Spy/CpxP family protein refolding chaperone [Syntrophales bacterium]
MMTKAKKVTMTAVAMLFVAAIATSAFGFGWGRGPGCGYGPMGRGDIAGFAGVELTAEQKAQIQAMRDAQFKETASLREQMFAKRDEVRKLWLAPNPDQAQITAAQQEMRSLRDQIQDKMTAFRLEALKVLTPEQREKLNSAVAGRGFGPGRSFGPGARSGGGCPGCGPGAGATTGKP